MLKYLGKHYGTERYFVVTFLCFIILTGTIIYSCNLSRIAHKEQLTGQVIYTYDFVWSRTSTSGKVVSVASNSDHTKVFMLLKNGMGAEGTVSLQSTNASDYIAYISCKDGQMTKTPKMSVYSYGNTGYVGFYITDVTGFNNEIWSIILRSDTTASNMIDESEIWKGAEHDVSFHDHNQIRLYMNFGGTSMPTAMSLNAESFDPIDVYCELTDIYDYENEYQNALMQWQGTLSTMRGNLKTIAQYRTRLEEQGIIVPELPYYIKNDVVNMIPNDFNIEPMMFDPEMIIVSDAGPGGDIISYGDPMYDGLYKDTNEATDADVSNSEGATYTDAEGVVHGYYYLHTQYFYPGGIAMPWQGTVFTDNLFAKCGAYDPSVGYRENYSDYLTWKNNAVTTYSKDSMPQSVAYDSWRIKKGDQIQYFDMTATDTASTSIRQDIEAYLAAVNSYMSLKYQYQVGMYETVLERYSDARSLEDIMTINTNMEMYTY